jgi:8-oxo-dGTP pyrophosphatase MutT (NUDIX family)
LKRSRAGRPLKPDSFGLASSVAPKARKTRCKLDPKSAEIFRLISIYRFKSRLDETVAALSNCRYDGHNEQPLPGQNQEQAGKAVDLGSLENIRNCARFGKPLVRCVFAICRLTRFDGHQSQATRRGMDYFLGGEGPLKPARAAVALIVLEDGRYLLQLRDQKPGIFFPGHWGLFGGAVESGETPEQAVRREIKEELELSAPLKIDHVTDFAFTFGTFGVIERHVYKVPVPSSVLPSLTLNEGVEMRAFQAAEILNLPRVVPYDSFAIWLHASGTFGV